jgi:L-rhamnose mutarotase
MRNPGRRFAQIIKLKPEFVEKYKDAHASVWPEVLKEIRDCNIRDCKSC